MAEATQSPGWYPDPDGAEGERWWNGVGWSDSRRGGATQAAAPVSPLPPPPAGGAQRVVYSADNPAPQAPGDVPAIAYSTRTINARLNPMALYGFIAGIVAVVFNLLLVPSILAIVFSARGLTRANQLQAQGESQNLKVLAILGLLFGIGGGIWGLIQAAIFVVGIVSTVSVSVTP